MEKPDDYLPDDENVSRQRTGIKRPIVSSKVAAVLAAAMAFSSAGFIPNTEADDEEEATDAEEEHQLRIRITITREQNGNYLIGYDKDKGYDLSDSTISKVVTTGEFLLDNGPRTKITFNLKMNGRTYEGLQLLFKDLNPGTEWNLGNVTFHEIPAEPELPPPPRVTQAPAPAASSRRTRADAEREAYEFMSKPVRISAESGQRQFQALLAKYQAQTGSTDRGVLLSAMAMGDDWAQAITILSAQEKYAEASGLLTFFFQKKPSLMENGGVTSGYWYAEDLANRHNAPEAMNFIRQRESSRNWESFLEIAIPAAILIYGGVQEGNRREATEAADRQRQEAAAERQRQAQHDSENARRRADGRPSLEAEEQQSREQAERNRQRFVSECLQSCSASYHRCLGSAANFRAEQSCEYAVGECQDQCK